MHIARGALLEDGRACAAFEHVLPTCRRASSACQQLVTTAFALQGYLHVPSGLCRY